MRLFNCGILGNTWVVNLSSVEENPVLADFLGYTDRSTKNIHIRDIRKSPAGPGVGKVEEIMRSTLRHELAHAMLFECGMMDTREYSHEQIADWIQMKFHDMEVLISHSERQLNNNIL